MGNLGFAVRALTSWFAAKQPAVAGTVPGFERQERRRSPRREYEVRLSATAPTGHMYTGYSRDISDTGMGALLWGELRIGEEVLLSYRFPDVESDITLRAIVRQRVGYRYGLEFQLAPDRNDSVAIQRLLCCATPAWQMEKA